VSSAAAVLQERPPLRLVRAALRGLDRLLFGAIPLALAGFFAYAFARGFHTFDFQTFWNSGRDVLHGRSPYPDALPEIADRATFRPFVYPAPAAFLLAPLALIPYALANVVFAVTGAAAVLGALRLLGVDDWRCYGAAFVSLPVFDSIDAGTITPLLVLGSAALWRYRERPLAAGALVAALVALKVFLWPLALWLLFTRRFRATVYGVVIGAAGTFGAWAVLGFAGLREYPHLLDKLTELVAAESFSLYAFALSVGASPGIARAAILAAGVALLGGAAHLVRRREGDRRAFALVFAAAFALSPVVWPHYLALLFVPLALARARLSALWVVSLPLWFVTETWSSGEPSQIVPVLGLVAAVLVRAARAPAPAT
jgi:hypothetical protein